MCAAVYVLKFVWYIFKILTQCAFLIVLEKLFYFKNCFKVINTVFIIIDVFKSKVDNLRKIISKRNLMEKM